MRALSITLMLALLTTAFAFAPAPRRAPTAFPPPPPPPPTSSEYRAQLERHSGVDAYYEVYRCSRPNLGQYTNMVALVNTSSGALKSRYLAHNVRLYSNDRLVARSHDLERNVAGASEHNFITSISSLSVAHSISCPMAFITEVRGEGWHKGISIHGHQHIFYSRRSFRG